MAEPKDSSIKTPFSDAIVTPKKGGTKSGGSDKAKTPSATDKEMYHTETY